MKIRIAGYVLESIVDGPGIRFTLFTQGCLLNCPGCHNLHTHSLTSGKEVEIDEIISLIKGSTLSNGLTITGGEPFLQAEAVLELINKAKPFVSNIIVYTGYTYEALYATNNPIFLKILSEIDYLIDGPYRQEQRDLTLSYRGSKNQRIIDLSKSSLNKIVLKHF